jgi:hypothetical protein
LRETALAGYQLPIGDYSGEGEIAVALGLDPASAIDAYPLSTIVYSEGEKSVLRLEYPTSPGLQTGQVVKIAQGVATPASAEDLDSAFSTIGVYDESTRSIVATGKIANGNWNWVSGQPLFLGRNGTLVQVPIVDGLFLLQVARVITPSEIFVNIQQPIYL